MTIQCSQCHKGLNVPPQLAGKKVKCSCGNLIDVPASDSPTATNALGIKSAFETGIEAEMNPGEAAALAGRPPDSSDINLLEHFQVKDAGAEREEAPTAASELTDGQLGNYLTALERETAALDEAQITAVELKPGATPTEFGAPPALSALELEEPVFSRKEESTSAAAISEEISDDADTTEIEKPKRKEKRKTHLTLQTEFTDGEPVRRVGMFVGAFAVVGLLTAAILYYSTRETEMARSQREAKAWVNDLIQSKTPRLNDRNIRTTTPVIPTNIPGQAQSPVLQSPSAPTIAKTPEEPILFPEISKVSDRTKPWDLYFRGDAEKAKKKLLAVVHKGKTNTASLLAANEIATLERQAANPKNLAVIRKIPASFEQKRAMAGLAIYGNPKQRAQGLAQVERMLKDHPKDPLIHYYIGEGHRLSGQPDLAIAAYRKAVTLRRDFVAAHIHKLDLLTQSAKTEVITEAINDVKAAVASNGDSPTILRLSGELLKRSGQFENAVRVFEQLRKIQPTNVEVYDELASLYRNPGKDPQKAEEIYHAGVLVAKDSAQKSKLLYGLAQLQAAKENYPEAIETMGRAMEFQKTAKMLNALGVILYNAGRFEAAIKTFDQAIATTKDTSEILVNKGLAYLKLKDNNSARKSFEESLKAKSTDSAYYYLARLYLSEGKNSIAKDLLEKSLTLNPSNANAQALQRELN